MNCPKCEGFVDRTLMNIEINAEEDGIEVNFKCPHCRVEQYAVLTPGDFAPVE